jgi:hypothetical protein
MFYWLASVFPGWDQLSMSKDTGWDMVHAFEGLHGLEAEATTHHTTLVLVLHVSSPSSAGRFCLPRIAAASGIYLYFVFSLTFLCLCTAVLDKVLMCSAVWGFYTALPLRFTPTMPRDVLTGIVSRILRSAVAGFAAHG